MKTRFLKSVALEEVDAAYRAHVNEFEGELEQPTLDYIRACSWSEVELLAKQQLGGVWSILHVPKVPPSVSSVGEYVPGKLGPIWALAAGWRDYLQLEHPVAKRDLEAHNEMLESLRAAGIGFSHPLIVWNVFGQPSIADGGHRAFAAFESATERGDYSLRVYWGEQRL